MIPRRLRAPVSAAFAAALLAAFLVPALNPAPAAAEGKHVVVLGFDGLDADLVREMMDAGRLPNLSRMEKEGGFSPLGTSIPPQSPVAWSNFITGLDSGGHGIFDFIHRDPATMIPYLSTSVPIEPEGEPKMMEIGDYVMPLSLPGADEGGFELLRRGTPFWETLEENGVPTMIIRMPANFPVSGSATYEVSGMGTPDVRGTYGTFSFWSTDRVNHPAATPGGGQIYNVRIRNHRVKARIEGPYNPLLKKRARSRIDFEVHLDPEQPYALLEVGDESRVLRVGEWSDWVPMDLEMMGFDLPLPGKPRWSPVVVKVMSRFYLKSIEPHFELYASPLDYDPVDPGIPMAWPESFAKEIAEENGRYYTEGMPEDTAGLDAGVLTIDEFLAQAKIAGDELIDQYPWFLDKFEREFEGDGLLFYYTGNQDLIGHMLFQMMDPEHPDFDPETHAKYKDTIPSVIEGLDEVVGYTLDRLGDDTTVIVMSDHGFASWRREMNLNAWLRDAGYLVVKDPDLADDPGLFFNIDWAKTRAYGFGINSIYVNLRGREKNGIVDPADRRSLIEEIAYDLVKLRDPKTGMRAVTKAYITEDAFHDRGYLDIGPDMIVGYHETMRCSNKSAMGGVPLEVFGDNHEAWGADHCMDHESVPGVLFSNRPLRKAAPTLQSLAAAILAEFGIEDFAGRAEELKAVGYIAAGE